MIWRHFTIMSDHFLLLATSELHNRAHKPFFSILHRFWYSQLNSTLFVPNWCWNISFRPGRNSAERGMRRHRMGPAHQRVETHSNPHLQADREFLQQPRTVQLPGAENGIGSVACCLAWFGLARRDVDKHRNLRCVLARAGHDDLCAQIQVDCHL